MKIFLDEEDEVEIKPLEEDEDRGLVILPRAPILPTRQEPVGEIQKEMAALDALDSTVRKSAEVHTLGKSTVSNYTNGIGLNEDAAARVLSVKHSIKDVAVTKLMQTLNLINPENIEKEKDKVAAASQLANVIERMEDKNNKEGSRVLHLHLYGVDQKKEVDYPVIDV